MLDNRVVGQKRSRSFCRRKRVAGCNTTPHAKTSLKTVDFPCLIQLQGKNYPVSHSKSVWNRKTHINHHTREHAWPIHTHDYAKQYYISPSTFPVQTIKAKRSTHNFLWHCSTGYITCNIQVQVVVILSFRHSPNVRDKTKATKSQNQSQQITYISNDLWGNTFFPAGYPNFEHIFSQLAYIGSFSFAENLKCSSPHSTSLPNVRVLLGFLDIFFSSLILSWCYFVNFVFGRNYICF